MGTNCSCLSGNKEKNSDVLVESIIDKDLSK